MTDTVTLNYTHIVITYDENIRCDFYKQVGMLPDYEFNTRNGNPVEFLLTVYEEDATMLMLTHSKSYLFNYV